MMKHRWFLATTAVLLVLSAPVRGTEERPCLEELLLQEALASLEALDGLEDDAPSALPGMVATRSVAEPGWVCLPTCDVTDGRFLSLAGSNMVTLVDPTLRLQVRAPADAASFRVGIFDGDALGTDADGRYHWDTGAFPPSVFRLHLFADPDGDGISDLVVPLDGQSEISSLELPDNAWRDFVVATGPEARSPSGTFVYQLRYENLDPRITALNGVRFRAAGATVTIPACIQPLSFVARWSSTDDLRILYPEYPATTPTTYDGTFTFYFESTDEDEIAVWEGDADRGKHDGTDLDTDDPDTPCAPWLPPWATADACCECVAKGRPGTTGNPPDDQRRDGSYRWIPRSPSVVFDLVLPDGRLFHNPNPSGNQEWEQFRVANEPFDRTLMDYWVDGIPPGIATVRFRGLDVNNLTTLKLPGTLLCVDPVGDPCPFLRSYLVGDTVFLDSDRNGFQDPGEPGIGGVDVALLSYRSTPLATTTTDSEGRYLFEVDAGTFRVVVGPENFLSGAVLNGLETSTGVSLTETVVDDNVLTFDFGFYPPQVPGTGTIGYWKTHPESWPLETIVVAGVELSRVEALGVFRAKSNRDMTIQMAQQLIAALLNVRLGNPVSCIAEDLAAADAWLQLYPLGSGVAGSSPAWSDGGEAIKDRLDAYNNGRLCAPARD